jgi:hypothetical protein
LDREAAARGAAASFGRIVHLVPVIHLAPVLKWMKFNLNSYEPLAQCSFLSLRMDQKLIQPYI